MNNRPDCSINYNKRIVDDKLVNELNQQQKIDKDIAKKRHSQKKPVLTRLSYQIDQISSKK